MAKVQHYRGLNTNLDKLYDSVKRALQDQFFLNRNQIYPMEA
jgi:hypothetical protein